MNTIRSWYAIFRFLYCSTRFLSAIFILSLTVIFIATVAVLSGAPDWWKIVYTCGLGLWIILLLATFIQFGLLVSRKTFVLCGNYAFETCILVSMMLLFTALLLAPTAADPLLNPTVFARAVLLIWSLLLVLMCLTTVTVTAPIIPFLPLLMSVILPMEFFGNWIEMNHWGLYALLIVSVSAWMALMYRLRRGKPAGPGVDRIGLALTNKIEQGSIFIWPSRVSPGASLGLASLISGRGHWMRDYTFMWITVLGVVYVIGMLFRWWAIWPSAEEFQNLAAALIYFALLTVFIMTNKGASSARKLWLMVPGTRQEILQMIERHLLKTSLFFAVGSVLPAAVFLIVAGENILWIAAFCLFVVSALAFVQYLCLSSLDGEWLLDTLKVVSGLLITFAAIFCWTSRSAIYSLIGAALLLAVALILRPQAFARWQRLDMRALKNPALWRQG